MARYQSLEEKTFRKIIANPEASPEAQAAAAEGLRKLRVTRERKRAAKQKTEVHVPEYTPSASDLDHETIAELDRRGLFLVDTAPDGFVRTLVLNGEARTITAATLPEMATKISVLLDLARPGRTTPDKTVHLFTRYAKPSPPITKD